MLLHESAVYSASIEEMLLVEPLIDARDRLPCIDTRLSACKILCALSLLFVGPVLRLQGAGVAAHKVYFRMRHSGTVVICPY